MLFSSRMTQILGFSICKIKLFATAVREGNPFRYCKGFGGIVEFICQIWLRSTNTAKERNARCPGTMPKGINYLEEGYDEFTTPFNDHIEGDSVCITNIYEQTIFIKLAKIAI